MATKRQRRKATYTILILLLVIPLLKWGYPATERLYARVAGHFAVGPTAATAESVAELDREMQEIGRLTRERQAESGPAPAERPAWPAPGNALLTSDFGSRIHPILRVAKLHAGLDIGAPEGADVVSLLSGKVILVKTLPSYGQIVVVDHGGKLSSVYAHLSKVTVEEGEHVQGGTPVGRVGSTGAVTGPHLHFELRQDGEPVNPASLLPAE